MSCKEIARIQLPWADKIMNYCPVHANQLILLGQAMGTNIQPRVLHRHVFCESAEELTQEEKALNKDFNSGKVKVIVKPI